VQALPQARRTQKQRAPAPKPQATSDFREEAGQIANQLKLLTRFLFVYGKISNGLETADEQARRGESSDALQTKIKLDKADVVNNLGNIKAGLENVAQSLKAKPQLRAPYIKLSDAVEVVANAQRLAAANRFDEAGKALLGAADRLSDLLVELALKGAGGNPQIKSQK
jgi:hypothetical protein